MPQRPIQLRRARTLFAYWQRRRLVFHNFSQRRMVFGQPVTCEVLDFFSDWRTPAEAVAWFGHYSPRSVRSAVSQLLRHGLLLPKNSPEAARDARIANEWSAWLPEGSFHFATKDANYIPSNWGLARLKAILPKTPQPKFFKTVKGAKRMALPPAAFPEGEFIRILRTRRTHRQFSNQKLTIETISQLLFLVWGVTGYLRSPLFGKLPLKTSPSGGARHPGEVYLMALAVKGLKAGLYHYHPVRHELEKISAQATPAKAWRYCARQDYAKRAAALFLMTAVFRRTMWKYDKPRAYRVVLLETGHLCQTFCLVATWLGLAPFCTGAFKDTLIEEDLGLDGISESMLYVAGVGMPPRRSRRANLETGEF